MEWVACNLCGSANLSPLYEMPDKHFPSQERFTVVECAECGLGFVNPRPSPEEMGKYYPAQYFEEGFEQDIAHHLRRYAAEARYLREIEKRDGKKLLLDVGCANGGFPRLMKARGWTVEGVEVSAVSRPVSDFPVYAQPFPEIPFDEARYDAVTAWAVLEHVHDPMAHFRKAAQVLKKRGLFVFLVNNFRGVGSRHLFLEDVPRHLYFFSPATVEQYLARSGFELERTIFRGDIYNLPPRNWLHYFIRARVQKRKFCYEDIGLSWLGFLRENGLRASPASLLKFAYHHPVSFLDRALLPIAAGAQMLRGTYGVVTYVARKARPGSGRSRVPSGP
jgi:SAM-dependent methyltransferase